jgi:hypothetical protein
VTDFARCCDLNRGGGGAAAFQAPSNTVSWIKHFELNAAIMSPHLQKYQHAQTTAVQCLHPREIEQDNQSFPLLCDCVAQPESSIASYNPACAVNNGDLANSPGT